MITVLMALFIVLFSISSTNISKVKLLEQSLQEAFSGPVLTGGRNLMQTGDTSEGRDKAAPEKPLPSLSPAQAVAAAMKSEDSESAMAAVKRAAQEEEASRTSRSASTSSPPRPACRTRSRRPSPCAGS